MALAKEQTLTAKNGTKVLITSPSEDDGAEPNPRLETVRLKMHSKNFRAISLYEKCGFILEGKEVRAIKFSEGTYDDVLLMACHVQS